MDFDFNMRQVVELLSKHGLEQPREPNKRSYYAACPDCDPTYVKPGHGHMNINFEKKVFRCPKCGYVGGMLDLYARYAGTPRETALRDIEAELGISRDLHLYSQKRSSRTNRKKSIEKRQEIPVIKEYPVIDIDNRDATYRALLNKLGLASDHKENLLVRGFSEDAINQNGYKTTLAVGQKAIARQLQEEGFYLSGVPGFYRDADGEWTLVPTQRGILIPVRDSKQRIQGLQVRRDNVNKRKFRWISSTERLDGCGAEGWVHLAGPIREEMLLIEGPMKADVVYHLSGLSAFAIPGVNSLSQLELALTEAKQMGIKKIMTALDMDMLKNFNVQNGFNNLIWLLNSLDIPFGTYLWHPGYNGLDDYIWKYQMMQILVAA